MSDSKNHIEKDKDESKSSETDEMSASDDKSSSHKEIDAPNSSLSATEEDAGVDDYAEFVEKQEKLQAKVAIVENLQSHQLQLRPCESCEFPDPHSKQSSTFCWGLLSFCLKKKPINKFWIISAPGDSTPQETFEKLNAVTLCKNLSTNYKFHIPEFRTGTIDDLLYMTDDLKKLDMDVEGVVRKLIQFIENVIEDSEDLKEFFKVNQIDIPTYITRFNWNAAKYPIRRPLRVISELIRSHMRILERDLKARITEHNELEKKLQKIQKQQTGNLLIRNLADLVEKDDFILNSEFLTTLLVVVPNNLLRHWEESYTRLAKMVVPGSAAKLFQDDSHSLFGVAICKNSVDEFRKNARNEKFVVRDFEYSAETIEENKDVRKRLHKLKKSQLAVLRRWMKANFGEAFSAWIHIKALRVFVESAIRYGLPLNFQPVVLIPLKSKKKLRKVINKLYQSIDNELSSGNIDNIPGALTGYEVQNYYSYVFDEINMEIFSMRE